MADYDLTARGGEFRRVEQCQTIAQDSGEYLNCQVDQRCTHNGELPHSRENDSNSTLRYDISTEPLSLQPESPQIRENHSFVLENNTLKNHSALAIENVAQMQKHHVAEHQQLPRSCLICGKDFMENSRAMVHFLPSESAPSHVSLHVFCGKTASILPQTAQPHLEIMLKAGLKNKHGIGPDVNFALARTRSAVGQGSEAEKDPKRLEKEYYLVKEFEGHLESIRSLQFKRDLSLPPQISQIETPVLAPMPPNILAHFLSNAHTAKAISSKPKAHKASRNSGMMKNPYMYRQEEGLPLGWASCDEALAPLDRATDLPQHGRVKCPCGGIYNPSKGATSWKAHIKTKRHALWISHSSSSPMPINNIACTDLNRFLSLPAPELGQSNNLQLGNSIVRDEGQYTIAQPHNDHRNCTVAQSHTYKEHEIYPDQHHFENTSIIIDGIDVPMRQGDATKKTQN